MVILDKSQIYGTLYLLFSMEQV